MVKRRTNTAGEILSGLEPRRKEITEKFRGMVKNTIPDAKEIVRRGRITYVLNGKDFLSIRTAQSHVDLLFVCGTTCESHLLKGRGSGRDQSHVEIRNMSDFDELELVRLLKESERIARVT
jgi:hypothetical protein